MKFISELRGALTLASLAIALLILPASVVLVPGFSGLVGSFLPYCAIGLCGFGVLMSLLRANLRGRIFFACGVGVLLWWSVLLNHSWPVHVEAGTDVTVGSFNVLGSNVENGGAIANLILGSEADVFVVLEAAPIRPYLAELQQVFPFRLGCDGDRCDLAVFSKLPIQKSRILTAGPFSPRRVAVLELDKAGTPFTLIAAHVTKPYFDSHGDDELEVLGGVISAVQGPLVVAGDFNQAAWSPALSRLVNQASLHTGGFEPGTFPTWMGDLGIPIDHIFSRNDAAIRGVRAFPDALGSNHRGLIANITIAR